MLCIFTAGFTENLKLETKANNLEDMSLKSPLLRQYHHYHDFIYKYLKNTWKLFLTSKM